jgi:hypothetical protein
MPPILLKVIGRNDRIEGATVVADPYVPLTFSRTEEILPDPFYWMAGDRRSDRVTIKTERSQGDLIEAVLEVAAGPVRDLAIVPLPVEEARGVPRVATATFEGAKAGMLDSNIAFRLYAGPASLLCAFGAVPTRTTALRAGRARFWIAEDAIIGLEFVELTPEERETVCLSLPQAREMWPKQGSG